MKEPSGARQPKGGAFARRAAPEGAGKCPRPRPGRAWPAAVGREAGWERVYRPGRRWFWNVGLGLDGSQAALAHDPADAIGRTDLARVGEFLADSPVAVAAAMVPEDGLDQIADPAVLALGGRGRGRGSPGLQPPYSLPPPRW